MRRHLRLTFASREALVDRRRDEIVLGAAVSTLFGACAITAAITERLTDAVLAALVMAASLIGLAGASGLRPRAAQPARPRHAGRPCR